MEENHEITELIKQLNNLGYFPYQIHSIIQEIVGNVNLNNLTLVQERELVKGLQSYIEFAIKCIKTC
ncbi:hypothetical protein SAMN04488500_102157 [Sporomusa malonica]|uniref:Uncharacterized protein n=1 Tax=Sporomusa malonica TaxID=112901 RepID=A0A1W1YTZ6_9FIRM|nr:hypothetical protein SAMN04488500_102157 [Sporomusa malonica]